MSDSTFDDLAVSALRRKYEQGYQAGLKRAEKIAINLIKGPEYIGDPYCDGWDGGVTAVRIGIVREIGNEIIPHSPDDSSPFASPDDSTSPE